MPSPAVAPDELDRFREEWRREVTIKKVPLPPTAKSPPPRIIQPLPTGGQIRSPTSSSHRDREAEGHPISPKAKRTINHRTALSKNHSNRAVELYGQAVDSEQSGQLNDALRLYRKAFRLDDDVERAYSRLLISEHEELIDNTPALEVTNPALPVTATPPPALPYVFKTHAQYGPDYQPLPRHTDVHHQDHLITSTDPLSRLIETWDLHDLRFEPEEERWPVRLESLPEEVFENVLRFLDVQSVERLGLIAKKARVWTRQARNWRRLVEQIYLPPLLSEDLTPSDLAKRHGNDWRTTFIEEPRVRYDGVYISVCHYVRPGASDVAWVNITHLITYHRFLRFYPDGTVLSLLTTDQPVDVVHSLRPTLRSKGLNFGIWELLRSKSLNSPPHIEIRQLLEPGVVPKYEFEMDLSLKTTQRGRWNKLDLNTYRSINLATEESLNLSLKHQKPFYFSKVRSYHPSL